MEHKNYAAATAGKLETDETFTWHLNLNHGKSEDSIPTSGPDNLILVNFTVI